MVMPRIPNDETNSAAAGAAAEEGRRPTLVAAPAAASPELSDRPQRRNFGAKYKLQILDEIDRAASTPGAIGAILRREGIYSSSITEWRRLRATGAYEGLSPVKRGPKPMAPNPLSAEHAQLKRDHKRLQQRLERAEAVIEIQKTYGPPRPQEFLFDWQLTGLHQRIRHNGWAVAKMESRTSLAS